MNPADIPVEALLKKHPERAQWEARWSDYRLAYKGGYEFLLSAGQYVGRFAASRQTQLVDNLFERADQARRFLWQLQGEPDTKYNNRWQRAAYVNYLGAIIDYFRHWLYSQPPQIRPADGKDTPDWWSDFYANASGCGVTLIDVARESFLDVLLERRAGWLIGKAESVAETDDEDRVTLTPYAAHEILDWQCDSHGELEWITLCKTTTERVFPDDRVKVETVTYLDRAEWHTWEIREKKDAAKSTVIEADYLGGAAHGLDEVPFVLREIPPGLWVADKLFAPCMSLFNRSAMLEYAEHVGCYLQPFIRSHEMGHAAESRILGEGILLHLRVKDGERGQEEYGWISPDIAPLQHLADRLRQDRDELYRSVHQMSLAVDSQAVGAIARSGASKVEDRRATEIILAGFGRYELRALVQTANLVSKVYGDNTEWVGDGFENFQTSTLDEELQMAALAQAFNIESATFNAELQKMIATGRILPHLDEATKQKIEDEIDEAAEQLEVQVLGDDPLDSEQDDTGEFSAAGQPPSSDAIDIEDQGDGTSEDE